MENTDFLKEQKFPIFFLKNIIKKEKIANAFLFIGEEGVGKLSFAKIFAAFLNCPNKEDIENFPFLKCQHNSCRKFLEFKHPDILLIHRENKKQIEIDKIRNLKKDVLISPYEAKYRIIIIKDAFDMNKNSANALLKVLEETPPQTIFILTAKDTKALLPTIVSRCQVLRFNPISNSIIKDFLIKKYSLEEEKAHIISNMSGGNLLKIDELLKDFDRRVNFLKGLNKLFLNPSIFLGILISEKLTHYKDNIDYYIEILKIYLLDIIIYKYNKDKIINKDFSKEISLISENYDKETIIKKINLIYALEKNIKFNANLKLLLENLFLSIIF